MQENRKKALRCWTDVYNLFNSELIKKRIKSWTMNIKRPELDMLHLFKLKKNYILFYVYDFLVQCENKLFFKHRYRIILNVSTKKSNDEAMLCWWDILSTTYYKTK